MYALMLLCDAKMSRYFRSSSHRIRKTMSVSAQLPHYASVVTTIAYDQFSQSAKGLLPPLGDSKSSLAAFSTCVYTQLGGFDERDLDGVWRRCILYEAHRSI